MKVISIQMLFKIRRLNNNPKKVSIIGGERHGGLSPGFPKARRSGRLGEANKEDKKEQPMRRTTRSVHAWKPKKESVLRRKEPMGRSGGSAG